MQRMDAIEKRGAKAGLRVSLRIIEFEMARCLVERAYCCNTAVRSIEGRSE